MPGYNHHYIPQKYLQGFTDTGARVSVYELGKGWKYNAGTRVIANESGYYELRGRGPEVDPEIFEKMLAHLEASVLTVFEKIDRAEKLEDDDRAAFSVYIAFMLTRVPRFRNWATKLYSEMKRFELDIRARHPQGFTDDRVREVFASGKYDVIVDPQASLDAVMQAPDFAPWIGARTWFFHRATGNDRFITSDNPVAYFTSDHFREERAPGRKIGVGLASPDSVLTFPVSKTIALYAVWPPQDRPELNHTTFYTTASSLVVKHINLITINFSTRYVYSSSRNNTLDELIRECTPPSNERPASKSTREGA